VVAASTGDGGTFGTRSTDTSAEDGEILHPRVLRRNTTTTTLATEATSLGLATTARANLARVTVEVMVVVEVAVVAEEEAEVVVEEHKVGVGKRRSNTIPTVGQKNQRSKGGVGGIRVDRRKSRLRYLIN